MSVAKVVPLQRYIVSIIDETKKLLTLSKTVSEKDTILVPINERPRRNYWILMRYTVLDNEYYVVYSILSTDEAPHWADVKKYAKLFTESTPKTYFNIVFNEVLNGIRVLRNGIDNASEIDRDISMIVFEPVPPTVYSFLRIEKEDDQHTVTVSSSNGISNTYITVNEKISISNKFTELLCRELDEYARVLKKSLSMESYTHKHYLSLDTVFTKTSPSIVSILSKVIDKLKSLPVLRRDTPNIYEETRVSDIVNIALKKYYKVEIGDSMPTSRYINTGMITIKLYDNIVLDTIGVADEYVIATIKSHDTVIDKVRFPPKRIRDIGDFIKLRLNPKVGEFLIQYAKNRAMETALFDYIVSLSEEYLINNYIDFPREFTNTISYKFSTEDKEFHMYWFVDEAEISYRDDGIEYTITGEELYPLLLEASRYIHEDFAKEAYNILERVHNLIITYLVGYSQYINR